MFSGGGGGCESEEKRNAPVHVDAIPLGLPRLRTLLEGETMPVAASMICSHSVSGDLHCVQPDPSS
ncbi:hypothetical protein CASFOL_018100 [Castilleja foliolosa]|uniref:Uncharacterized protein n=1 Tax=Castilleja foliolosa TaxID=1961234 RepID=A0ABD3DBD7_9LAMI